MFDIKWIRANPEAFDAALGRRKGDYPKAAELIALDERRREVIARLQEAQEQRNASSRLIGQAKAQKDEARAQALLAEVAGLKEAIQQGEAEERAAEAALRARLAEIPNLPADDIPTGDDESANIEYFGRNGTPETAAAQRPPKPSFSFTPKEHFETGEALGMMDFEVAAKLSGSRFVVLKSHLARLERAIGQFMLDLHVDHHGYTEVQPPLLVKDDALFGTGQLPKFSEDQYYFASAEKPLELDEHQVRSLIDQLRSLNATAASTEEKALNEELPLWLSRDRLHLDGANSVRTVLEMVSNARKGMTEQFGRFAEQYLNHELALAEGRLWLIPTAEVPLTNLVRESILSEDELPLRFTALTPCFRSEAGSAGRDTRGMIRQHQFNKVEMVAITTPETSGDEHEKMLADAEDVLRQLGLHYRVMTLSSGDMGFGAQKTYDLEVWLPGQDAYREISSVSVCGDFQARRMEAQYRPASWEKGKGSLPYVHTLNGSGVAVGRALVAVMENYQQEDGTIAVPAVLQRYMGGLTSIGGRS